MRHRVTERCSLSSSNGALYVIAGDTSDRDKLVLLKAAAQEIVDKLKESAPKEK